MTALAKIHGEVLPIYRLQQSLQYFAWLNIESPFGLPFQIISLAKIDGLSGQSFE